MSKLAGHIEGIVLAHWLRGLLPPHEWKREYDEIIDEAFKSAYQRGRCDKASEIAISEIPREHFTISVVTEILEGKQQNTSEETSK